MSLIKVVAICLCDIYDTITATIWNNGNQALQNIATNAYFLYTTLRDDEKRDDAKIRLIYYKLN